MNNIVSAFIILMFVSFQSFGSVFESNISWLNKNVKVCFARAVNWDESRITEDFLFDDEPSEGQAVNYSTSEKVRIKKVINQNFTANVTGIHFIGWKDCDEQDDSDVFIYKSIRAEDLLMGKASIGYKAKLSRIPNQREIGYIRDMSIIKKEFILINTEGIERYKGLLRYEEVFDRTVMHEFGHLAGLRHEISRVKEARSDSNCIETGNFDLPPYLVEKMGPTAKSVSDYDSNSIMNDCFGDVLRKFVGTFIPFNEIQATFERFLFTDKSLHILEEDGSIQLTIGLSEGDKATLKYIYP